MKVVRVHEPTCANTEHVLVVREPGALIVGVFDGDTDWGGGKEFATRMRGELIARWRCIPRTAEQIEADILAVHGQYPTSEFDEGFGATFSLLVAGIFGNRVEVIACGAYGLVRVGGGDPLTLFSARLVADELDGKTAAVAEAMGEHVLQAYCGPFVARECTLSRSSSTMRAGQALVLVPELLLRSQGPFRSPEHAWSTVVKHDELGVVVSY